MSENNHIKTALLEEAVRERYSEGAKGVQAELCCPVSYDPKYLDVIPQEVFERDYGCGDPSQHLRAGETVLDLGSGSGKICFIASQVVGTSGRVIGVDMNDDMLALARGAAPKVAEKTGYANVEFRKGKIQDLGLDVEKLEAFLSQHPVNSAESLARMESKVAELRVEEPLIPGNSIDVVVSNCVLNLVKPEDKQQLFREIFRVLRPGGRAVISDIVSDEDIPEHLQNDTDLWSGCLSGAFREDSFLRAFEETGFYGISILQRQEEPWRTIEGIEFRSVTVEAFKGKEGICLDQGHAVVYRGPFREVHDDDGHTFRRGERVAVCEKTFRIFSREPYLAHVELIEPRVLTPLDEAPPFPCTGGMLTRHPRETKGMDYNATTEAAPVCIPSNGKNGSCC